MRRFLPLLLLAPLSFACTGTDTDDGDDTTNPKICLDIEGSLDVDGLTVQRPTREINGCEYEFIDEETARCNPISPDLSCFGQSEPLGTPISITYTGCVNSFGLMAQSNDLTISTLLETMGGNPVDPGYDVDGAPGSRAENSTGALINRVVSVAVAATQCIDLGHFTMENVMTETPMIVRVTDQHLDNVDRQYIDTYQYNVVLRNSMIREGPGPNDPFVGDPETYCAANPCYIVDDVNTVVRQTFTTIALTAGVTRIEGDDDLYDGVGQGHVAGEIQDCSSEDTIQNAAVAIDTDVKKLAYFDVGFPPSLGNLENARVDQSRSITNADGLYAAIAADAQNGGQPVKVAAAVTRSICGTDGVCRCADGKENPDWTAADTDGSEAETMLLGSRTIFVFPDSISILTFDRNMYTVR